MIPAKPRCVACGYDLSGIAHEHEPTPCPECGELFDPNNPFGLQPWPNAFLTGVALASPIAFVFVARMTLLADARRIPFITEAWFESVGIPAVNWLLIGAWLIWPGVWAMRVVRRCAHPVERGILWAMLYLSGVGLGAIAMLTIALILLLI